MQLGMLLTDGCFDGQMKMGMGHGGQVFISSLTFIAFPISWYYRNPIDIPTVTVVREQS
jgi:hypothetical protein